MAGIHFLPWCIQTLSLNSFIQWFNQKFNKKHVLIITWGLSTAQLERKALKCLCKNVKCFCAHSPTNENQHAHWSTQMEPLSLRTTVPMRVLCGARWYFWDSLRRSREEHCLQFHSTKLHPTDQLRVFTESLIFLSFSLSSTPFLFTLWMLLGGLGLQCGRGRARVARVGQAMADPWRTGFGPCTWGWLSLAWPSLPPPPSGGYSHLDHAHIPPPLSPSLPVPSFPPYFNLSFFHVTLLTFPCHQSHLPSFLFSSTSSHPPSLPVPLFLLFSSVFPSLSNPP